MYEIVFADADPESVRLYNKRINFTRVFRDVPAQTAMLPLQPPVDWSDTNYGEGIEVSVLFDEEPEDREIQSLMSDLNATALTVRKVEGVEV